MPERFTFDQLEHPFLHRNIVNVKLHKPRSLLKLPFKDPDVLPLSIVEYEEVVYGDDSDFHPDSDIEDVFEGYIADLIRVYTSDFQKWKSISTSCSCSLFIASSSPITPLMEAFHMYLIYCGDVSYFLNGSSSEKFNFHWFLDKIFKRSKDNLTVFSKNFPLTSDSVLKLKHRLKFKKDIYVVISELDSQIFKNALDFLCLLAQIPSIHIIFSLTSKSAINLFSSRQIFYLNPRKINISLSLSLPSLPTRSQKKSKRVTRLYSCAEALSVSAHLSTTNTHVFRILLTLAIKNDCSDDGCFIPTNAVFKSKAMLRYKGMIDKYLHYYYVQGIVEKVSVNGVNGYRIKMTREDIELYLLETEK
ncbi:hypothetical protein GEMRC1_009790 [Eukaryota sp. GEM-RC1]